MVFNPNKYGHVKENGRFGVSSLPNDIAGDVSFEELRAYAYDAGKQGMPLQSLVCNEYMCFSFLNMYFIIL